MHDALNVGSITTIQLHIALNTPKIISPGSTYAITNNPRLVHQLSYQITIFARATDVPLPRSPTTKFNFKPTVVNRRSGGMYMITMKAFVRRKSPSEVGPAKCCEGDVCHKAEHDDLTPRRQRVRISKKVADRDRIASRDLIRTNNVGLKPTFSRNALSLSATDLN